MQCDTLILMNKNPITIQTTINAPIEKVWECWNNPEHITKWAFVSDDWEAPFAENDIRTGGKFKTVMAAKDPSASSGQARASFDFTGTYTNVDEHKLIEYDMEKAASEPAPRHVKVEFTETSEGVKVVETFDPENENSEDIQRSGWQAILDNFKKYTENN